MQIYFIIALCLIITFTQCVKNNEFVILIASYNNAKWYKRNLNSVFRQTYKNYEVIYIDDVSTDHTGELVKKYIAETPFEKKVKVIINTEKCYCLKNYYREIQKIPDNKIIVTLDGDDWLAHPNVLRILNQIYSSPDVWLTYGSCNDFPGGKAGWCSLPIPLDVLTENRFRNYSWDTFRIFHLRSFYAGLFKKIKYEDLLYKGNFIECAEDVAFMIPMIEMAGSHVTFVPSKLYTYNRSNSLSQIHTFGGKKIQAVVDYIYKKNKYKPLASLFY